MVCAQWALCRSSVLPWLKDSGCRTKQFIRNSRRVHRRFTRAGILGAMNPAISTAELFKRPSAFLPVLMSLAAVGLIVAQLATHGTAPQRDEGTAAHLWQLLMVAQGAGMIYFLIRWVPVGPRAAWQIFGIQLAAALLAIVPVLLLKW